MDLPERSRLFVYRNARPLDLARWKFQFEQGSAREVLRCLRAYQNPDGGFGHGLEPDCWNPHSTPLQTWAATKLLRETGTMDKEDPIIQGIVAYLSSEAEFDGHFWHGLNTVPSNNDYPHAPWWHCTGTKETSYNPTASLAGFLLCCTEEGSPAHALAARLVKEAYTSFRQRFPLASMHETACFVELYGYLRAAGADGLVDPEEFKSLLQQQLRQVITYDTSLWSTEYICRHSLFIRSRQSEFFPGNEEICRFERDFIAQTQNADGTWNLTWSWDNYPEQWALSKNWWKTDLILQNLSFWKAFSEP